MTIQIVPVVAWLALLIAAIALGMVIHLQNKLRSYMRWNWAGLAQGVMRTAENAWGNIPPEHRDRLSARVATLANEGMQKIETASPW